MTMIHTYLEREIKKVALKREHGLKDLEQAIEVMDEKVAELLLINRALWAMLAKEKNLTEADLLNTVEALRGSQKLTKPCKACGTTLQNIARKCYSCGRDVKLSSVFDVIE